MKQERQPALLTNDQLLDSAFAVTLGTHSDLQQRAPFTFSPALARFVDKSWDKRKVYTKYQNEADVLIKSKPRHKETFDTLAEADRQNSLSNLARMMQIRNRAVSRELRLNYKHLINLQTGEISANDLPDEANKNLSEALRDIGGSYRFSKSYLKRIGAEKAVSCEAAPPPALETLKETHPLRQFLGRIARTEVKIGKFSVSVPTLVTAAGISIIAVSPFATGAIESLSDKYRELQTEATFSSLPGEVTIAPGLLEQASGEFPPVANQPAAHQQTESVTNLPENKEPVNYKAVAIEIDSINLKALVVQTPKTGNTWNVDLWHVSQLENPENRMMFAGHLSTRYSTNGVFKNLENVKTGDMVSLRTNNRIIRLEVTDIINVPKDAANILEDYPPDAAVFITCGGKWENGDFTERRIVVAAPKPAEPN